MNAQPYQLIFLLTYSVLAIGIWKIRNKRVKIFLAILGGIIFFVNPIRFKQEGGAKIERNITRFEKLPEKVGVGVKEFQQRQDEEMNKLKKQSEDLKDEIHD